MQCRYMDLWYACGAHSVEKSHFKKYFWETLYAYWNTVMCVC